MKKTIKTASIREPHNYWIERRVWVDDDGVEYVKINGNFVKIDWLYMHDWQALIVF